MGLLNMQEACLNPLVTTCTVQRARICDGSTYALDIIAPHYGHPLVVLPWQEFADKNTVGVFEIAEFGHHIRHLEAGFEAALMHVQEDGDMDIEAKAWLLIGDRRAFAKVARKAGLDAVKGISDFGALIRLPVEKYERAKAEFLNAWTKALAA